MQVDGLATRRELEESPFEQRRLADLGQLLILAADMADDVDGIETPKAELTQELADDLFEDIMFREYPDGPEHSAAG
jgi:hypothetical protein